MEARFVAAGRIEGSGGEVDANEARVPRTR